MFIRKVIQALEVNRVEYAVVGGYAVAMHGAVRGTVDIDLAIALSQKSYERTENAMQQLGLQSRLPVSAGDVFKFRKEYISNRNLIAWSFINSDNPLEVVDILITEDASKLDIVEKQAFDLKIRLVSIPELIRMKRQSNRPQDVEDIRALEKIK